MNHGGGMQGGSSAKVESYNLNPEMSGVSTEAATSRIALNSHENTIEIQLIKNKPFERFVGTYSYENLPI